MKKPFKPIKIKKPTLSDSVNKAETKPWTEIFKAYGFRESSIPTSQPPQKEDGYGSILTWVTSDGFEPFEHEIDLAIDIWMGKVDIWNIEIKPEITEKDETPSFFKKF